MSVCRGTLRNALSVKIKLDKPFVLFSFNDSLFVRLKRRNRSSVVGLGSFVLGS